MVPTSYAALREMTQKALIQHGAKEFVAVAVAEELCRAEKDGDTEHGIRNLSSFCSLLRTTPSTRSAEPDVEETSDAVIKADAQGGFAHPCLHVALPWLMDTVWETGIAVLTVSNCRGHIGTLWGPLEKLAEAGLIAIGTCNTPAYVAWPGSTKPVLGTNPFGFAWPRKGKPPLVIDQASSLISRGHLAKLAEAASVSGDSLPTGAAVDKLGRPTSDAKVAMEGAQLPFGGHKGANIALMVELLSILAGGSLALESRGDIGDAESMDRGMVFIAIAPDFFPGGMIAGARAELLFEHIRAGEGTINDIKMNSSSEDLEDERDADLVHAIPRLPGDTRYKKRAQVDTNNRSILLSPESHRDLLALASVKL